ncbi:hypothetical protein [Geodermatophilus sp. SYSU D00766]
MRTLLAGGRLLDAGGATEDGWVLLDGDTITATGTGPPPPAEQTVDLPGAELTPGFVDLHAHGGGGSSFDDGPDAIRRGLAAHRAAGTTRSVVSLVAAPVEELAASLAGIADLAEEDPTVLGAHLEGPFLAPARCGAHDPATCGSPPPATSPGCWPPPGARCGRSPSRRSCPGRWRRCARSRPRASSSPWGTPRPTPR